MTQTEYDAKQAELAALKQLLTNSDYKCLKYVDGALTDDEYSEAKAQRAAWREAANTLQEELDAAEITEES